MRGDLSLAGPKAGDLISFWQPGLRHVLLRQDMGPSLVPTSPDNNQTCRETETGKDRELLPSETELLRYMPKITAPLLLMRIAQANRRGNCAGSREQTQQKKQDISRNSLLSPYSF